MDSMSGSQPPVVLFDGPCNLCNAAVRWLIERDQQRQFRFASLQSDAARDVLAAANTKLEELPDSIVLVEGGRAFTRSDAAIRIARRMGFPWAMLSIAAILPRFVRDGLYAWVARNRYGWFGRQNACLAPTPALRARFLDADEPLRSADAKIVGSESGAKRLSGAMDDFDFLAGLLRTWVHRFVLVYLLLYILPFPLSALMQLGYDGLGLFGVRPQFSQGAPASAPSVNPVLAACQSALEGVGEAVNKYEEQKQEIVVFVAKQFGTEISVFPQGSGDTTYNYYELLVYAAVALVVALGWTLLALGRPVSLRTSDAFSVYVRYNLAATLLGYGFIKVWPLQMPPPGPDRFIGNIGDMSPMGIIWTMMGASVPYQTFSGLGEVTGGVLLLFRRTTLLGALVSAGVLANVVALNYCFDIPVKLYSSHLLLQALFLIIPHGARLAALLLVNLPAQPVVLRPFALRSRALWVPAQLFKFALLASLVVKPPLATYESRKQPREMRPWEGLYQVESFVREGVADRALEDSDRWVRVGISNYGFQDVGAIQRANGRSMRHRMKFDERSGTVTITTTGEPQPTVLRFKIIEPGVMDLTGSMQGATIYARLRRDDEYKPLLTTRGFHWINEYPLNR